MKRKNKEVMFFILKVVGAVVLLSIVFVAPKALEAMKLFNLNSDKKASKKYYLNKTIERLSDKGHLKLVKKGSKKYFKLTELGKRELAKYELRNIKLDKPQKWDHKWRVVIFDIKEHRRRDRDLLRKTLKNIGFKKIQNSVWVYPYDCSDFVFLLKSSFSFGKDVLYMKVDRLENDTWLKKEFRL